MNGWYFASSQIKRNSLRSGLMAAGIVIAATVITAVALLIVGINEGISNIANRMGADVMVVPRGETVAKQFNEALLSGKPATFYLEQPTIKKVAKVRGIDRISEHTYVETLTNARCCAGQFFLVGFNLETDFTVKPWLESDLTLPDSDNDNWMIVGNRILLRKGETAQFYGTLFRVAGVLEPTGTGMDWTIYISDQSLRRLAVTSTTKAEIPLKISTGSASALLIKAKSGVDLVDLAEKIEQNAPEAQVILSSTVAKLARSRLSGIARVLGCLVAGLWMMALVLTGLVFSMAVRKRRSQIGLLVAKGASKSFVFGTFIKESVIIAATSSVLGCVFGLVIVVSFRELLSNTLQASDVLPNAATSVIIVATCGVISTVTAVLAAILPVVGVLRTEPYEAIKQGNTI